jgi:hypothetical protein
MKAPYLSRQEFQRGVSLELIRWQGENSSAQLVKPSSLYVLVSQWRRDPDIFKVGAA